MKNILTLILLLQFLPGFSKEPLFEITGKYTRSVKIEKLSEAKLIRDIIDGYASNWITDYVSAEIIAVNNGKLVSIQGKDETLNTEQKNLLKSADLFSHIVINVKYKYENAATGKVDTREMSVTMTVVPEFEAEFIGGSDKMKQYLKANAIDKIDDLTAEYILDAVISFTVKEDGSIINAKLTKSTGDDKTDSLLLTTIIKMPKWKPAVDSKGVRMKQDFEFKVGNKGC